MNARDIARPEWHRFLRHFSRLHSGAIITMNISGGQLGQCDAVIGQPLRGISEDGNDVLIHIEARRRSDHLGHRVVNVRAIHLRQTGEGKDEAIDIEAADGTRTIVRFRSPMLPELLEAGVE